jgi:hypothetical protein
VTCASNAAAELEESKTGGFCSSIPGAVVEPELEPPLLLELALLLLPLLAPPQATSNAVARTPSSWSLKCMPIDCWAAVSAAKCAEDRVPVGAILAAGT